MIYDFSLLFKDEVVADVHIDTDKKESSILRYTMSRHQMFMCDRQDIDYIYMLLKDRCFDDGRPDLPQILAAHGLSSNDAYEWCRRTHGVSYNDFWWLRFPGEELTWDDVKPENRR